jgi:hypothetical protein
MEAYPLHVENIGIENGDICPGQVLEECLNPLEIPKIQHIQVP